MQISIRCSLLFVCMLLSAAVKAQDFIADDEPAKIPLDSLIKLDITGRDTAILEYYTLYGFTYSANGVKVPGEIMVPKKEDTYRNKIFINTRLCRVKYYVNSFQGLAAPPMEVGDYLEVERHDGKEKQFFNFDTELPNAVYSICESKTASGTKR